MLLLTYIIHGTTVTTFLFFAFFFFKFRSLRNHGPHRLCDEHVFPKVRPAEFWPTSTVLSSTFHIKPTFRKKFRSRFSFYTKHAHRVPYYKCYKTGKNKTPSG